MSAAFLLLEKASYEEITVERIISTSGVAKQTFYNHYNGKQEVYVELGYKELLATVREHVDLACEKSNSSARRIEAFFEQCENYLRNHGDIERVLFSEGIMATNDPERLTDYIKDVNDAISRLIEPATIKGTLREGVPFDFCLELISGTLSSLVMNWTNTPKYPLRRNRKLYTRMLIESLLS